jgi:hypothetical protein
VVEVGVDFEVAVTVGGGDGDFESDADGGGGVGELCGVGGDPRSDGWKRYAGTRATTSGKTSPTRTSWATLKRRSVTRRTPLKYGRRKR